MGQTLSTLKNTRAAVKNVQSPSASITSPRDDTQCQSRSLQNQRIVKSPSGKYFSRYVSKTVSKTFCTSRDMSIKPARKTLLDLPAEIIFNVAEYLPPSSLVSLELVILEKSPSTMHRSSTCNQGELSITRLSDFGLLAPLLKLQSIHHTLYSNRFTSRTQFYQSERFGFLCMLGRDKRIPSSKAICSECANTHDSSFFSTSSLAQPNTKRRYLGSAGFL